MLDIVRKVVESVVVVVVVGAIGVEAIGTVAVVEALGRTLVTVGIPTSVVTLISNS